MPSDLTKARCKLCKKEFSLSNMGKNALLSHAQSGNHLKKLKEKDEINNFFKKSNIPVTSQISTATPPESHHSSTENEQLSTGSSMQQTITSCVLDSKNLIAEIIWALKCVMGSYSNNSNTDMNETFRAKFPDSNIAKNYQMSANKLKYMVNWGLAPYFKDLLVEDVNKSTCVSIAFDESLNKITQTCQMDLTVRYWDVNRVQVRYWGSSFLGHTSANDLLHHFIETTESINQLNIIHVSMDGPAVNQKLYRDLEEHRRREKLPGMIDFGSCNLHILHGAFKTGFERTDWEIKKLLKASYQILHDSPARRADFISVTESTKFPLSFCATRWVEDKPVADRLLEIWPNIVKIVNYWSSLPKSKQPKCKSFEVLTEAITDDLIPLKLSFFSYMASLLQPFLKKYQSDKPLIPFLYDDLTKVLKMLLQIIVKEEKLDCLGKHITKIDLKKSENLKSLKSFHLGLATETMLKELKRKDVVAENDVKVFLEMVKICVTAIVTKLFEKCPLNSVIIRSSRIFNPSLICAENKVSLMKMIKVLTQKLHMLKIIDANCGDKAYDQYGEFIDKNYSFNCDDDDRLDNLFFQKLNIQKFPELAEVAKIIFIISHGQADVERGFSVNGNVIDVNMKEHSMESKRLVRDHMQKHNLKPATIDITNKMKKSCRAAYQRYKIHLEEEKKKATSEKDEKVKQILDSEIKEVQEKIDDLIKSSVSLDKKFVDLVRLSENNTKPSMMISEANALKRKSEEQIIESEKLKETLKLLHVKRSKQ